MVMLCWFYCIPFAKLMYFSSAPLLLVFALFMIKRGVRHARRGLQNAGFIMIFLALLKICIFDLRMLNDEFLCASDLEMAKTTCNDLWKKGSEAAGLLLLVLASGVLFLVYGRLARIRVPTTQTPEEVNLPFWANLALYAVVLMTVWQLAPWVGYLTVGSVPKIFAVVSWQVLAIMNVVLLLYAFWVSESCNWEYNVRQKDRSRHLNKSWTQRDTLWMAVFIYLVTLALSYVAHDVLTQGGTQVLKI